MTAVSELTDQSEAYNKAAKPGTEKNPYRFLCTDEAVIYPSFVKMLKDKAEEAGTSLYFTVEVREGDRGSGRIRKMWMQDAKLLAEVPDSWRGTLHFADKSEDSQEPGSGDSGETDGSEGTGDSGKTDGSEGSGDSGKTDGSGGSGDSGKTDDAGSGKDQTGASGAAFRTGDNPYRIVLLAQDMEEDAEDYDEDDESSDYGEAESLIPADAEYTKEELAEAIIEENETIGNLQLDIREARLKLRKAREALSAGKAVAAVDGVVMKVGNPKKPPRDGSAFLQIGAVSGFSVRGAVSEREMDKISSGTVIRVTSWQSGAELTAVVDDISPYPDTSGMFASGDSTSSYYPFTANIREKGGELEEGEWVELALAGPGSAGGDAAADADGEAEADNGGTGEDAESADGGSIYLMKAFVRSEGDKKYIYKRDKEKKLKKTYVEVGRNTGYTYEILSGLSPDDWVAFPYGRHTGDGAKTRKGTFEELEEM